MSVVLVVLFFVLWIGGGAWLIDYFDVDTVLVKILIFGVTGLLASGTMSLLAVKVGVLDKEGNPR